MDSKRIKLSDISPVMLEVLEAGGEVTLTITGTSMLPLLVAGRDTVTLKKPDGRLEKCDLPLYRRTEGAFVLHRVVRVTSDSYVMCGDNQFLLEAPIYDNQIIGVVTRIKRKGKSFEVTSPGYRAYCRVWTALLTVRYPLRRLRFFASRLRRTNGK
ncbi:MAG: hypothetical protein GX851_06850 [Clostridiales bacterium]|jgi:hypothetical protein|nr:hypothetical protein [Clostridiales bacterium]